jgi:hypothetical protein
MKLQNFSIPWHHLAIVSSCKAFELLYSPLACDDMNARNDEDSIQQLLRMHLAACLQQIALDLLFASTEKVLWFTEVTPQLHPHHSEMIAGTRRCRDVLFTFNGAAALHAIRHRHRRLCRLSTNQLAD